VAGEHGFADISHTLEIFGTCAPCRRAEPGQKKSQTAPSAST
jgi:Fur family ferric uptake transcriptional regulator